MKRSARSPPPLPAAPQKPWLPYGLALALGAVFTVAARVVPIGRFPDLDIVSGYGSFDNRRLLMTYGALAAAAIAGPFLAWLIRRGRPVPSAARSIAGKRPPIRNYITAAIAATLTLFVLIGPGVAYRALNGHELVHLGYINEIEHGRVLNVDTRVTYGPLLGYSMWAFMKLVRFSLVGFRLYWSVANAAFLAALFLAAAPWFRRARFLALFPLFALLGTTAVNFLPDMAGMNGGLWGLGNVARHGWTALAVLLLARPLARTNAALPRVLGGAAIAWSALYSPETLLPASCAVAALFWSARPATLSARLIEGAQASFGAALVALVALSPVLARNRIREYFEASRHVSELFMGGFGNTPYPPFVRSGSLATENLPYYLFPAMLLVLFTYHWNARLRDPSRSRIEFPLALYGLISCINMLVRADSVHLTNVTLTPLLTLFLTIDTWLEPRASASPVDGPASSAPAAKIPRLSLRPATLAVPALLASLFLLNPGPAELVRGFVGRLRHWSPRPPAGFTRLPGPRGDIWTPDGKWFDSADWGCDDDPAAVEMIRSLTGGRPVFIAGPRASLYYFLCDVPCAISCTDLPSQCFTRKDYIEMNRSIFEARPDFVFVHLKDRAQYPRPRPFYRLLGRSRGFWVFQSLELPELAVIPAGG